MFDSVQMLGSDWAFGSNVWFILVFMFDPVQMHGSDLTFSSNVSFGSNVQFG